MQNPITRGVCRYVSSRYNRRCDRTLVQAASEYGDIVGGVAEIGGESMGFVPGSLLQKHRGRGAGEMFRAQATAEGDENR